jgi:hypothetical protein
LATFVTLLCSYEQTFLSKIGSETESNYSNNVNQSIVHNIARV